MYDLFLEEEWISILIIYVDNNFKIRELCMYVYKLYFGYIDK